MTTIKIDTEKLSKELANELGCKSSEVMRAFFMAQQRIDDEQDVRNWLLYKGYRFNQDTVNTILYDLRDNWDDALNLEDNIKAAAEAAGLRLVHRYFRAGDYVAANNTLYRVVNVVLHWDTFAYAVHDCSTNENILFSEEELMELKISELKGSICLLSRKA